jgi:hypothetical protein
LLIPEKKKINGGVDKLDKGVYTAIECGFEPLTILICFCLQKIYEQNQEGRHSPGRI